MHRLKCEAHSRNKAENLPFATNRLVKIDDLKAKIESDDESKNHRPKHLKAKLKGNFEDRGCHPRGGLLGSFWVRVDIF